MKKVVRLTESDLIRLVKRVIKEEGDKSNLYEDDIFEFLDDKGYVTKTVRDNGGNKSLELSSPNDTGSDYRTKIYIDLYGKNKIWDYARVVREITNEFDVSARDAEDSLKKWIKNTYKIDVYIPGGNREKGEDHRLTQCSRLKRDLEDFTYSLEGMEEFLDSISQDEVDPNIFNSKGVIKKYEKELIDLIRNIKDSGCDLDFEPAREKLYSIKMQYLD